MKNKNKHIGIQIVLISMLLLGTGGSEVWAQSSITVQHWEGQFYKAGDMLENGMQKTNTHRTTVYMKPGESKSLEVPTAGTAAPHSYCRWFNYNTDSKSDRITANSGNAYKNGLFNYNKSGSSALISPVTYKAPATFTKEDAVAVETSAYIDWETNGYLSKEPTLSYRWIFDVKPASVVAGKLREATDAGNYLEDKIVYVPQTPVSSHQKRRVTLDYDLSNYYVALPNTSKTGDGDASQAYLIQVSGSEQKFNSSFYSTPVYNAAEGKWVRYYYKKVETKLELSNVDSRDGRILYIKDSNPTTMTVRLKCTKIEGYRQTSSNQNSGYTNKSEIKLENVYYNIARFTLKYQTDLPENYDNLEKKRTLSYLESNFVLINKLDFDYDTAPATASNNAWLKPLQWDYCSYGFTSALMYGEGQRKMASSVTEQNEYGFYKTANIDGISKHNKYFNVTVTNPKGVEKNTQYRYVWYNNEQPMRDRLYHETKGKEVSKQKAGYFLYVDASEKPGTVAKLPLDNKLCAGTKLIVSAGVASFTHSGATSFADLNFVFKGIDETGNEVELNRYTTGDIPQLNHTESKVDNTLNTWYQVYYSFDYASEVEYDRYILQIENNATSTTGGDYAIDDIRVYRSKPAVQAKQIALPCEGEETAKIKIAIGHARLIEMLNSGTDKKTDIEIRYQFMDDNKKPVTEYNYHAGNGEPFYEYGSIWIKSDADNMTKWVEDEDAPEVSYAKLPVADGSKTYAYIENVADDPQGQNNYIVFKTPNNDALKYNQEYYITVANSVNVFETEICSLISDEFVIKKPGQITVDGESSLDGRGICYGSPMTLGAILLDRINKEPIVPCKFDWYFGNDYKTISSALSHYRAVYKSFVGDTETKLQDAKDKFTADDYLLLDEAIHTYKLYLNLQEITRRVMKGETVLARPIEGSTGLADDPNFDICTDVIQLDTGADSAMPDISIGQGVASNAIRMSRAQIEELTGNTGKTLWIPVNSFENSDKDHRYDIVLSNDAENLYTDDNSGIVFLCGTTDPDYMGLNFGDIDLPKIARLKTIYVGPGKTEQYLVFSFNPMNEIDMKEGYVYKFLFFYNEKITGNDAITYSVCNGVCSIDVNIVPKYLTWTGKKGDNWNNNENWRRSTVDELYKDPTNNDDFSETDESNTLSFVPMHNSMVTIANTTDAPAPWLQKLTASSMGIQNISDNLNHPAVGNDSTDYKANAPTPEMEHALEVWTGSEINKGNYTYAGQLFKGNSCEQIYFKPQAEMRNTQYLTYDKAHVDFELTNNRWYMLSSPLQGVVAGDMYIPTDGGRQVTEAFKDIEYVQGTTNNRFDPAVYQRNWSTDNAENFRPYEGSYNVRKVGIWSDTYNRVDEKYNEGRGFSIRPIYFETADGSKEIKEGHQTLFRLPKADTRYEYYAYNNDNILDSGKGWIAGTDRQNANGRLALTPGIEEVKVNLTNNHNGGGELFLAGNPFMATLDMTQFFAKHESTNADQSAQLKKEYILLTDQGQCYFTWNETTGQWDSSIKGIAGGTIAPLQGFFVKRIVRGASVNVTYTPDMTIAKPSKGSLLRSAQTRATDNNAARLYVTAERNGFQSHILIEKQFTADNDYNDGEDIATLMDSNLKDQPTLYSVSGSTVVSINKVCDQKRIPLGIYSENSEDVTLTFSGADSFSEKLFLYDVQNQTYSEINAGTTFTVPGNTHGRYFLSLGREDAEGSLAGLTAYSPEAGRIVIVAPANDPMTQVSVYNTLGMEVQRLTQLNSTLEEVTVPAGLYIVRIESREQQASVKVAVKNR